MMAGGILEFVVLATLKYARRVAVEPLKTLLVVRDLVIFNQILHLMRSSRAECYVITGCFNLQDFSSKLTKVLNQVDLEELSFLPKHGSIVESRLAKPTNKKLNIYIRISAYSAR